MKILWVTFGVPWPPDCGVRQRDYYLIRERSRDARITLLCLVPPGAPTQAGDLHDWCERVETWQMPRALPPLSSLLHLPVGAWRNFYPGFAARIGDIVASEQPDVLQIEHSLLAGYRDAVPAAAGCSTVLSFHNVAFEQYRRFASLDGAVPTRLLYRLKSHLMRRVEARYLRRFDQSIVVSTAEAALLHQLDPEASPAVVENGIDCDRFRPLPPGGSSILFTGMMNYPPNADAAVYFSRSVLPSIRSRLPNVKFYVVGHAPPPQVRRLAADPNIVVTGRVDDIIPYYRDAALTVVPLRAGGGTRLKVLESMALGRPIVSTSIGCEGILGIHDQQLLIADSPQRFAESVVRLLRDQTLRERLARSARRFVEAHYDWAAIASRLSDVHRSVVSSPALRSSGQPAPPSGAQSHIPQQIGLRS